MSGSNANNRWTLRLSTEGADQVIRDLRAAATESAAAGRAYDALLKAQPALANGAERAEQALRRNVDAMRGMRGELGLLGSAAEGAAGSLGRFGAALTSPAAAMAAFGAGAVAAGVSIAKLGDEYTVTMNKLRAATGSIGAASAVYGELVALSQQTGASISESAGAFVRFSVAARSIGATNGEVLQLTRTIQQAGMIAGASGQESAAGVQQLGQALASGKLQGDELRSILENMPTLAEALARELGVSIGQLRQMGSEGQLTSDRVFQALLRAGEQINKQFQELTPTMGQAFGILGQAMVDFVGKLDRALGLSQGIAAAARAAAGAVGAASGAMGPRSPEQRVATSETRLEEMADRVREAEAALQQQRSIFLRASGTPAQMEAAGRFADRDPFVRQQTERLTRLRQQLAAETQVLAEARAQQETAAREADDVRQAEEATARARREAAARSEATAAGQALRERNKSEQDLRREHAERIATIERNRLQGNFDQAEANRLRASEERKLAEEIRNLQEAERGRITTDEELVAVGRIVADIEKDRAAFMREGETITASVRTETERYAEQLSVLRTLLEQGAITQETFNRAVAAADPAARAAAEAGRRLEQDNARTTDRITNFFGDSFARAFEGTGKGFAGLMESFKRGAISTFATIAAQAIIRPIIAPIVSGLGLGGLTGGGGGGLNLGGIFGGTAQAAAPAAGGGGGGTLSSLGTLRQAYSGLTSPGGLGAFFPGGGAANTGFRALDGVLNTSLISPTVGPAGVVGAFPDAAGFQALVDGTGSIGNFPSAAGFQAVLDGTSTLGSFPSAAGFQSLVDGTASIGAAANPGLSLAGTLGPLAAIGGGAFGIVNGLQKGGVGGALGAAGGAVSSVTGLAMLGSAAGLLPALGALGPIGLGVGAVLAIAGALAPGAKPSGMGQLARSNLGSGELSYDGLGGARFSQGNRDAASGAASSITRLANEIGDRLGGARLSGTASVGVTNSTLYLDIEGAKAQFANNEDGGKQLADRAAEIILQRFKDQFASQGRTDETAAVLFNSANKDRLAENLAWYEQTYKALSKSAEQAGAYSVALSQAAAPYDAAIAKARELGLAESGLVAEREKVVAKLEEQRAATLRAAELSLRQREIAAGLSGGDTFGEAQALAEQQATIAAREELDRWRQSMRDAGAETAEVTLQIERLSAVQAAEAVRAREQAETARREGLQSVTNALLEQALAAGFGIDRVALEESQAALQAAANLRQLNAELLRLGASSEQVAELTGVATRNIEAQARQRASAREEAARAEAQAKAEEELRKVREAFTAGQSAYLSALSEEIGARERLTASARENVQTLRSAAEGLRDYVRGLALDSSVSPLTIEERLQEGRAQYARLYGQAQAGTAEARANAARQLQGLAGTRLGLAAAYYAPGTPGYVAEFQGVSQGLAGLADQLGMAASVEEMALRAQEASLGVLREQREIAASVGAQTVKSLEELRATFLDVAKAAGWIVPAGPLESAPVTGGSGGWPWDWADPRAMGNFGARASGESLFGGPVTAGEQLNAANVNALYQQFLGRDAEAGVVETWRQFNGRGFDLAAALQRSDEFQKRLQASLDNLAAVTAQGSIAVVQAVDGQTGVLVDATMPRAPVPA